MKTLNFRKMIAAVTVLGLIFNQTIPVGFAGVENYFQDPKAIGSAVQPPSNLVATDPATQQAIKSVTDNLATRLQANENQRALIEAVSAGQASWSDGCAGWGNPGDNCAAVMVTGYVVVLRVSVSASDGTRHTAEFRYHAGRLDPKKAAAIQEATDMGLNFEQTIERISQMNAGSNPPKVDIRLGDLNIPSENMTVRTDMLSDGTIRVTEFNATGVPSKFHVIENLPNGTVRVRANLDNQFNPVAGQSRFLEIVKLTETRTGIIQYRDAAFDPTTAKRWVSEALADGRTQVWLEVGFDFRIPVDTSYFIVAERPDGRVDIEEYMGYAGRVLHRFSIRQINDNTWETLFDVDANWNLTPQSVTIRTHEPFNLGSRFVAVPEAKYMDEVRINENTIRITVYADANFTKPIRFLDYVQLPLEETRIVEYTDATFTVVREPAIPPAVQEFKRQVEANLPASFGVHVRLISGSVPAQYEVIIDRTVCTESNGIERCVSSLVEIGRLGRMSFNVSADGQIVSPISVSYGVDGVDGQLLYEALLKRPYLNGLLPMHPEDSKIPVITALKEMTQSVVLGVDADGTIHFDLSGTRYKAFRDVDGNVQLDDDFPPAVQAYVDALKGGFDSEAMALPDGWWAIYAPVRKDGSQVSLNGIQRAKFSVKAGVAGVQYLTLGFYGDNGEVVLFGDDATLIDDATAELFDNPYERGSVEYVVRNLENMRAIKLLSSANGIIRLEENGKSYKVYRDVAGNVKLVDERLEVLEYLQAFDQSFRKFLVDVVAVEKPIADFPLAVSAADLETMIKDLGLSATDAGRYRNLHLYFRFVQSAALGTHMQDFPGFFEKDKVTGEAKITKAYQDLIDFAKAEELYVGQIRALRDLEWNADMPLSTLQGIVNDLKAQIGDVPQTHFDAVLAEVKASVTPQLESLSKINSVLTDLMQRTPAAVSGLEAALKKAMPGFTVTVSYLKCAVGAKCLFVSSYQFSIADSKRYAKVPTQGLQQMSFTVDRSGKILSGSVSASYYEMKTIDANLLFEGVKLLVLKEGSAAVDQRAVVRMSQIKIQKFIQSPEDSNIANIYFDYGGKHWLVYRDSAKKPQLVQVGLPLLLPAGSATLPAVIQHYDGREVLLRTIELDKNGLVVAMVQHVAGRELQIPAKAVVFPKGSAEAYSKVFYSTAGAVTKVIYHRYDITKLPKLQAPSNAMTFPSTLKHYDARGVLLREIVMLNATTIQSVTEYGVAIGAMPTIPAKVLVYALDTVRNTYTKLFSELYYKNSPVPYRVVVLKQRK